ncbi:hypothetical protein BKA70DRAFT_1226226 [Coprinopsis sp. MPI-PUGE-AT-0042]|nr:hypothetical protein BKA70DRAFT_1226226 [Coprinopsis sp. MPI-PUGE-AT-0042]
MHSETWNRPCTLLNLPVELLCSVTEYLPLYSLLQTLLSFALTSRTSYNISLPLLYSHLILRDEKDALLVLQKILGNTIQGFLVRGIHIYSEISSKKGLEAKDGAGTIVHVVRALQEVITSGSVPLLNTLELHLDCPPLGLNNGQIKGFRELNVPFWNGLQLHCPRLHTLIFSNIGGSPGNVWLNKSGIFEVEGLHALCLRFVPERLDKEGSELLLKTVGNISSHLRHLDLAPNSVEEEWMEMAPYWALDFPCLESLQLLGQVSRDTSKSMAFWRRHPSLEHLHLRYCEGAPLFSNDIHTIEGFLPKLKHLTAVFPEARRLASLLPRLDSLNILESYNAQAPYLLRSVIKNGLPNLRSLNIAHNPDPGVPFEKLEAINWYEALDGTFCEKEKGRRPHIRVTDPGWITSIVKAAPNIEEFALATFNVELQDRGFVDELSGLGRLKRFFFGIGEPLLSDLESTAENHLEFMALAKSLAAKCHCLEEVGDGAAEPYRGYITAKIVHNWDEAKVHLGLGHGIVIGQEDQAFPKTQPWAC